MKKFALLMLAALPLFIVMLAAQTPPPTPRADFAINCDRDVIVTQPGSTVQFDLYLTPINGFRGTVEVTCATATPHMNCKLPSQTFKLGADLAVPFTAIVATEPGAGLGSYPIVVSASGTYGAGLRTSKISHDKLLHVALVPRMP